MASEGAYTLRSVAEVGQLERSGPQLYSQLDSNVVYQDGFNLDQYTILFHNETTKEQAIVKVRFSPKYFKEIIEYEVELSAVPISNSTGKDVTVNWRMFDSFDAKGKFFTDSNSMAMQERVINQRKSYNFTRFEQKYAANYYPIDSAIAVRD